MQVHDTHGSHIVESEDALTHRLRTVRVGDYGAFILCHEQEGASLWICINRDLAYLHFLRDQSSGHAGFQPDRMTPPGCPEWVHFLQTDASEGWAFDMRRDAICSVEVAYRAAAEFMRLAVLPASVRWVEL